MLDTVRARATAVRLARQMHIATCATCACEVSLLFVFYKKLRLRCCVRIDSHTVHIWLMPKTVSASSGHGSTTPPPPAPTGRHSSLAAGEAEEIAEQVDAFGLLPPTQLLTQVVGIAASLQASIARTPFLPVAALPAATRYVRQLENARGTLNVLLPLLTNALTTCLALEHCLYDRYEEVLDAHDGVIAASRRTKRRRS